MEMMGPHLHSHTERKQQGKCRTPPLPPLHQAAAASRISFRELPQISVLRQPKVLTSHVSLLNLQVITTGSFQELLTMHSPLTTLNNYSLRNTAHKLKLNNCQLSIDYKWLMCGSCGANICMILQGVSQQNSLVGSCNLLVTLFEVKIVYALEDAVKSLQ